MASLLGLSNELLREIANQVAPSDLDNFALACQHTRASSAYRMDEHREKKKKFGDPVLGSDKPLGTLFKLIHTLSRTPENAYYIKRIQTYGLSKRWHVHYAREEQDWDKKIVQDAAGFRQLLSDSPFVSTVDEWSDQIMLGNEDVAFAFLLTMLPNLRYLSISLEMATRSSLTMINSILGTETRGTASSVPLTRLHRLTLFEDYAPTPDLTLPVICSWASITSLRHLTIEDGMPDDEPWQHEYVCSNVETLDIRNFGLKVTSIRLLIQNMPFLTAFSFEHCSEYCGSGKFYPHLVCQALGEYFSGTLKVLVLTTTFLENHYVQSLRNFRALKTVGLDMGFLIDPELHDIADFANVFPISTRTIQLYNHSKIKVIKGLCYEIRVSKGSLPNLRLLKMCDSWSGRVVDVAGSCLEIGVRCEDALGKGL